MSEEEDLLPSRVRARVLEDHGVLRGHIAKVRAAAKAARGDAQEAQAFRSATLALLSALRDHLTLEDELLLPTLRTIDAWGPERAKRLEQEHEHQREVLEMTERELSDASRSIDEAVGRIEQFLDRLEKDMALEEKTSLDEELLREYPIRTDFGGA